MTFFLSYGKFKANKNMNPIFKKRLKSFAWRLGGVVAIAILNEISKELTTLGFSEPTVVFLGLIIGECTKYLNSK